MYRYPASLRLLGAKSCNWKLSVRIILEHILFWGLFGIYDRAYKSNPIVKEICKLTEGFKLHKSLKNFLFQIPTLNTKCYSNKDEASIYNQTFVYNGQMQKKEELNVYLSLDFHPIPWVIYSEILIISPIQALQIWKPREKYICKSFFPLSFPK